MKPLGVICRTEEQFMIWQMKNPDVENAVAIKRREDYLGLEFRDIFYLNAYSKFGDINFEELRSRIR